MDFFYYGGEMQINIQNQRALEFHSTDKILVCGFTCGGHNEFRYKVTYGYMKQ